MKFLISHFYLFVAFSIFIWTGCTKEGSRGSDGLDGADGQNATVYYSEWFTPTVWSGGSGDWYFSATAPDLTLNLVESGVVLSYVWLAGDVYNATAVRPLPAFAIGANWSFLIHQYGSIEFTCDMLTVPGTTGYNFRFIAIPATTIALKSASFNGKTTSILQDMTYQEVCNLFNIPE